jgi:hypothetical protein
MVATYLRSKEALIPHLRSRGIEPDLRQEGSSLVFAVFPVTSHELGPELSRICLDLKSHFIDVTASHRFSSRLGQLTFSPWLCAIGPPRTYDFRLSHRQSERHVFASAVLSVPAWRAAGPVERRATVLDGIVACIERVREGWLSQNDRADFMGAFLSAPQNARTASPRPQR